MGQMGKFLILFGGILILAGVLFQVFGKIPGMGRLPGDIYIRKGSFTFYFPLATSLLMSAVLSLLFTLLWRK